jgi:ASC-1-like (ASCH) protein
LSYRIRQLDLPAGNCKGTKQIKSNSKQDNRAKQLHKTSPVITIKEVFPIQIISLKSSQEFNLILKTSPVKDPEIIKILSTCQKFFSRFGTFFPTSST